MKNSNENALTYIVFEEEGKFFAVCLEHWIGAQGNTQEQAELNLCLNYRAELDHSIQKTGKPFGGIPPAPEEYRNRLKTKDFICCQSIIDRHSIPNKMVA